MNLNFKKMSGEEKLQYANLMFQPLNSAEELRNWIMMFFDLDMPFEHIDPESNSSPVEAMWEIYDTVKNNKGEENPGYIMLSAREGYKTLSASMLEALLMIHFQITIAHLAAIQSQSAKAIQYINYFLNKIEPLLEASGWEKTSENKSKISYKTKEGEDVYIRVIVATMAGANSEHTNMLFVDEIDVVANPQAYEEAKLIPGYAKGLHPVTVKLSTRKFAFGLMQKEIDNAQTSGDKILRWNLLDVTERCPDKRHKPELPRVDRYVAINLPLRQIDPEEYDQLPDAEKPKWKLVKDAYAGCVDCRLLPVCETRLAERPKAATKGLYKPVGAVINTFKKTDPDRAEAQLLCWKPSTKGMVYPRFDGTHNTGNVITLEKAWETLTGEKAKKSKVPEIDVLHLLNTLNIPIYAGVDWGYTHDYVLVFFAMIPNGEIWIIDCYSMPGLEFADQLEIAKSYRDKYTVSKWYPDQAMPSSIKSFNKNGMKCATFTKDVMGGIEAIRSKIVDGSGRRLLKVLNTENNQKIITAFQKHHFKLDTAGNPTLVPDDTPGVADQADAIRYVGQNLFPLKGPQKPMVEYTDQHGKVIDRSTPEGLAAYEEAKAKAEAASQHGKQLQAEMARLLGDAPVSGGTGKKGGFHWSM